MAYTSATSEIGTVFAVGMVCAHDGVEHLVRDDRAAAAFLFGGQTIALCGHKITAAPLAQCSIRACTECVSTASVLDLAIP
jgi:hypothetical protein